MDEFQEDDIVMEGELPSFGDQFESISVLHLSKD